MNEPQQSWTVIVRAIECGDEKGMESLYRTLQGGMRFYLCNQLGPEDLDDRVHEMFVIVTEAIQRGDLREPERLMGYVRTIARRQVTAQIERNTLARRERCDLEWAVAEPDPARNPEQAALAAERGAIAGKTLGELNPRDREVLTRFYLRDEPADKIQREMQLTDTQFRLLKSRAKARFAELGLRRQQLPLSRFLQDGRQLAHRAGRLGDQAEF
jgi:RNA polymerase sigma-70 factor (ECF subfamily)